MAAPTSSPNPAEPGTATKPLTRLRHEHIRGWVAFAISLPLTYALGYVLALTLPRPIGLLYLYLSLGLLSWVLWSTAYALLTLRAYGGKTADELPALVSTRRVRTWQRVIAGGSDGPGLAVQFAALALAAAALLPRLDAFAPAPGQGILLSALIVLTVVGTWVIVTLSYAVHYARRHIADGGLEFPGDGRPGFGDYFYFSASVATTFGTTDVDVTSTRLRKVVTGHAVLTFVFNTVIIALMVSALTA